MFQQSKWIGFKDSHYVGVYKMSQQIRLNNQTDEDL